MLELVKDVNEEIVEKATEAVVENVAEEVVAKAGMSLVKKIGIAGVVTVVVAGATWGVYTLIKNKKAKDDVDGNDNVAEGESTELNEEAETE